MGRPVPVRGDMPAMTPLRSILALMLREMGSTYGDSPGGYVWAIVQPVGMIAVLSLGFSLLVKSPSLGTSFILFYATGYLAYDVYNQIMSKTGAALKYSKAMLAYPRVTWLDAVLARFFLNTLTLFTVFCIVLSCIMIFINTRTVISIQPILVGLILCSLIALGVGMMNCVLAGLFPVWGIIFKILTRPMFIASGVLFIYEDMPVSAQNILWWNPILHCTGLVRSGFYPTYYASYVSIGYCFSFSLILIAAGLLFLRAYHGKIRDR
jgi:capsular polysaccharide transport system permease protein